MKRVLSGLLVIGALISSCKKDKSGTYNNDKLHVVTFKVAGFSQQLTDFETSNKKLLSTVSNSGKLATNADTSLTNHAKVLYYALYDSQGAFLHSFKQLSSEADFGTIKDNLHAGSYTVVCAAGPNLTATFGTSLATSSLDLSILHYNLFYVDDTFYKKITINVAENDIVTPITLSRIVGKVVVNIEDAIPANAENVLIYEADAISAGFRFSTSSAFAKTPSPSLPSAYIDIRDFKTTDIGVKNYQFSFLTFKTGIPFNLTLTFRDKNLGYLSKKTISNIYCYPNRITLLTGSVFGGNGLPSNGGLSLGIDSTWAGSTTIPF